MSDTILTLANGKGVDLLDVRASDIDWPVMAEHLAKENRFNGATPGVEYSVGQHLCCGTAAMLAAGHEPIEVAYFHIHDVPEAIWKDDPTPKKRAIAKRISQRCGVTAEAVLKVLKEIDEEHERAVHEAAGLEWPVPPEIAKIVKRYDLVMFVTEWRDLMRGFEHPNWAPYADIPTLDEVIRPVEDWRRVMSLYLAYANALLPALGGGVRA